MRKSMLRPASLAAAVTISLSMAAAHGAPSPIATVAPPNAQRPPLFAGASFDLAIVAGDTKLEQRDPSQAAGVTAAFTVTLKNLGAKPITKQNVGCKLGKVELTNVGNVLTLQPGDERKVIVTTKVEWLEIPEGEQSITCAAVIAEPARVQDANSANNTWTGRITARPHVVPTTDLLPKAAALRDCATHVTATNAADTCVELEYENVGTALTRDYYVECAIERTYPYAQAGTTTRVRGTVPLAANGTGSAVLNMGKLALGQHRASCTLDRTFAVPETNENNNSVVAIASIAEPEYDLAILMVDDRVVDANTAGVDGKFFVTLSNNGSKDISSASVACVFGPSNEKLPIAKTSATVSSHAKPRVTVYVPHTSKLKGSQPLRCSTSIEYPAGVSDQALQNNTWTGTITVYK